MLLRNTTEKNWKDTTIGKYSVVYSGGTPNTKIKEYWNGEYRWLSSGETKNRFIKTTVKTITKEGVENSSTKLANKFMVVIASAGQGNTRGQVSFTNIDTYINQSIIAIKTDRKFLNPKWLYYNLSNRYKELRQISESNSIRGSLTTNIIKDLKIKIPLIEEQKAFADVLSSLDDKIELLRKQNETLEQIAQTIFKEWFVNFNFPDENGKPYKDSCGKMIELKLDEIPEGWRGDIASNLIRVTDGTHDTPKPTQKGKYLITSKHLSRFHIKLDEAYLISEKDFEEINKRSKVDKFDILLSMIGTVGIVTPIFNDDINFAIKNVGLFKTSTNPLYFEYIFLTLKSAIGNNYINTNLSGTTQKYVTLECLRELPILIPNDYILKYFKKLTHPFFLKIKNNISQIHSLINLRDTILPKLMSGKLRVDL